MEELLNRARSFPPPHVATLSNDEYHCSIEEHVRNIAASVNLADIDLEGNVVALLDSLDPAIHSASYGIILDVALVKHKAKVGTLIASHILQFAALFDTIQIRYIGGHFKRILETILTLTIFNSAIAVDAVTTALLRVDPDGTFLSSTRINLAKIAYQTSNIDAVYPLVSKTAIYFPGAPYAEPHFLCSPILAAPEYITLRSGMTGKLAHKDVMEYEIICGSIFCAKRNWKAARGAFSRCATQPMKDKTSLIGLHAYKKWILTSLIVQGALGAPNTPNPGTQLMRKSYLSLSKPYLDLAEAFRKTFADLRSEIESNATVWAQDNNTGLVNEVQQYFVKWRIGSLRAMYSKTSLVEIYDSLPPSMGPLAPGIPQLQIILAEMISEGMLSALLVEESGSTPAHVVFVEPATTKTPEELNARVVGALSQITQLKSSIRDINALLEIHPDYLKAQAQESKRNKPTHEDKPPKTFEKAVVDEDLMDDAPTE